jgi:hypothetical protein
MICKLRHRSRKIEHRQARRRNLLFGGIVNGSVSDELMRKLTELAVPILG